MDFWIETTAIELQGIFSTEYIWRNDSVILYQEEPDSEFAIKIDGRLLNIKLLRKVENTEQYKYSDVIFLRKGYVWFRFEDELAIKNIEARCIITLEVKLLNKYRSSFILKDYSEFNEVSLDRNILDDLQRYNVFKGAIVAYACAQVSSEDASIRQIILELYTLKNTIAGLKTSLFLLGESTSSFNDVWSKLSEHLKTVGFSAPILVSSITEQLNSMNSLIQEYLHMKESLKSGELHDKIREIDQQIASIKKSKDYCMLKSCKEDLNSIREAERLRGEAKGKTRKYFPKGSPERLRKDELKENIERLKYIEIKVRPLEEQKEKVLNSILNVEKSLESLFLRFSDQVNILIDQVREYSMEQAGGLNFQSIQCSKNKLSISLPSASKAEEMYYNLFLHTLMEHVIINNAITNNAMILNILVEVGQKFGASEESKSQEGQLILKTTRGYYAYKIGREKSFEIPSEQLPVLQAVMSFLIKYRSYAEIEDYMRKNGFDCKDYAYILYGASLGFNRLPKTFTEGLYSKPEEERILEEVLWQLIP